MKKVACYMKLRALNRNNLKDPLARHETFNYHLLGNSFF